MRLIEKNFMLFKLIPKLKIKNKELKFCRRVDLPNRADPVDLQLFEPKSLLPINEFDQLEMLEEYYNQTSNNTLLKPDLQKTTIANGRVIYRQVNE